MVKLQPVHGFAAEATAATLLAVTGGFGMTVSTTHSHHRHHGSRLR
jgi:inorganic phosphate transporter, PiT family